jgi:peptidoglycan/xylan/chitin deacetylase (PgdA/CDA1 family)
MLKVLKRGSLAVAKYSGAFGFFASSGWRKKRLLILCFHGISLKDEHHWASMFVTPIHFRRRMEILARSGYRVLSLTTAVEMLKRGDLPPKAVVITFDDGFHDFYREAFPILRDFSFPATVYQTTYYCDHPFPIFNLVLRYLFWCGAGRRLDCTKRGVPSVFDLSSSKDQENALTAFLQFASRKGFTPAEKDELAAHIAEGLEIDYGEIRRLRMLQLMSAEELIEIAAGGIDIQLHTHRHRTPLDEPSFISEVRENREWITAKTGIQPTHFCYPSGVYRAEFLPWLRSQGVVSATTCDNGLASRQCDPLTLPRLLDSMYLTDLEFEGWLCGLSSLLPRRKIEATASL